MHPELIPFLACPSCRGDLGLTGHCDESNGEILSGRLACTSCGSDYAVEKGIPRLVVAAQDVETTGRRFNFQWVSWSQGRFEETSRSYGFDNRAHTEWLHERLSDAAPLRAGDAVLDAGCGPGEVTAILADLCPQNRVVGLDLGVGALEQAQGKHGSRSNLDFVQGNIMNPPLKTGAFRWGISKGVLHHTPDTRRAFTEFRRLMADDAGILIWIYPTAEEGPEWRTSYLVRDVVFAKRSHRIPPRLLRWLCYGMVAAFFPVAEYALRKSAAETAEHPWFDPRSLTMKQRYLTQVFYLYDTLLPKYQFRHSVAEVLGWLEAEGMTPVYQSHGFYTARLAAASSVSSEIPCLATA